MVQKLVREPNGVMFHVVCKTSGPEPNAVGSFCTPVEAAAEPAIRKSAETRHGSGSRQILDDTGSVSPGPGGIHEIARVDEGTFLVGNGFCSVLIGRAEFAAVRALLRGAIGGPVTNKL
jgi:hypothetical protein